MFSHLLIIFLATLSTQSQESLPPVSYGKAIDIWMSCCAVFVFCSILEFAVINYLVCRFPEDENGQPECQVMTKLLKLVFVINLQCSTTKIILQNPKTIKARIRSYIDNRKIQIIAHNIDRLSRFFFPACFISLNIWYWKKYLQGDQINGVQVEENEM